MLASNIDRLLAGAWYFLSASFVVNSRHRTTAFTAGHWHHGFVDRQDEEAAGNIRSQFMQRALWRFRRHSQNKRKKRELFSRVTQRRGIRANLKTTIEVTIPVICVDLLCMQVIQAGVCCMQDRLHACLKAMLRTPRGLFWLILRGVNR